MRSFRRSQASLRARLEMAYRGQPPAPYRKAWTTNGFYSFWFLEKGGVSVTGRFGSLKLAQGDWMLVPPFLRKYQAFSGDAVLTSIGFEALWSVERPWLEFDAPIRGKGGKGSALIRQAEALLAAAAESSGETASLCRLQARLFEFLEQLAPEILAAGGRVFAEDSRDPRIRHLMGELRLKPSIRPLPYARWKKEVGLGRVQIDRLFRREFGHSPKHQAGCFLLAALKRHLLEGRDSVKEAATAFGFADSSHLCRWFRLRAGVSPEQFRLHGIE
jgi:AraC-like DNA-binding protein